MDISVRLVTLRTLHPRLLWDDIIAATVAVLSETRLQSPFPFALTVQDLPGFGSEQLQFTIDPAGVAIDHVRRLQRTYEAPRLVELAAIAIAGLGLYYGGGHEMRDVALRGSGADYLVDEANHLLEVAGRSRRRDFGAAWQQRWQRLTERPGSGFYVCVVECTLALALLVCLAGIGSAAALDYPTRPVKWVVPYPPGGTTDVLARIVSQWLSEKMGQPFLIENKAGGGNNIGVESVVTAAPDGYTMLLVNPANGINATLYKNLPFDFIRDIAPVAGLVRAPNVMEVTNSFPAKTVAEFIAYCKANPGKINMASSGSGTSVHLSGELFKFMTGCDMLHVPFKGAGPALVEPPQRLSAAPLCSHAGGAPVLAVPAPRAWHTRQGGRHQRRVEEKAV